CPKETSKWPNGTAHATCGSPIWLPSPPDANAADGLARSSRAVMDEVGRTPQYEVFADEFLEHASTGIYNTYLDRPACLALLGDVSGRTVLDAACGPGLYASELVERGANVIGFDQSPRMVEIATERVSKGTFRVHDLADPLEWLADASVDLVLFALAI